MAQKSIVNVESQVGQSVVNSTTDVDVSKTISSATPGGKTEENRTETCTRDPGTAKVAGIGTESGGNVNSDSSKSMDESRTQTPGVSGDPVDSDVDVGSGAGSPPKITGVEGSAKPLSRASVKKPQSFKAVSINKHFLEKASAGTNSTPSKTVFGSERLSSLSPQTTASSSATLSFAKPRLVAKSASGIRDSSPGGLGSSASGGAKNAVEAQRAVWNKNQPPPVVPAKEMTDEELKKTYGIHLASRLQAEDTGKESTWADEDDDEDWVPEPIEWNDGTKDALQAELTTPTTAVAVPVPPITPTSVPPVSKTAEREPSQRVPERPSEPKTLVFTRDASKGIDKSDKGIKDAPPPRSSPWATLPPPNAIPLPTPRSESRASEFGGSQHHAGSREVHADDFNRSWRDRPMNNQLYNSQTGQLEPVQDRNRALRNQRAEQQLGKTQVLQRPPSQLSGSAEPSPAFQQTRSSTYRQDEYRRRRTSSNVSGGSGSTGRRLSFNKGMYGIEHPLSPEESVYSPRHAFLGQSSIQSEAQTAHVTNGPLTPRSITVPENPQNEVSIAPTEDYEDPIAKQQRIMKEARELARKRKQEEEAKEEAAKKERLRLKLEALEKEAEAKAAKAAAEAEKAAQSAAAEAARLASTAVASSISSSTTDPNSHKDSRQYPTSGNNANATETINPPSFSLNHSFISEQQHHHNNTENSYNTSTFLHQPPTQTHSLASVPYRPGSFGNRSPSKKFSTLHQPSSQSQSSIPSSNTYNMPIRDPRYDPTLSGRFNGETSRWTEKANSRASPYGSIGDKSKYVARNETRSSMVVTQQYSNRSMLAEKPLDTQDSMPIAHVTSANTEPVHPQFDDNGTTLKAPTEAPVQGDKSITLPSAVDGRQTMTRPGRHDFPIPNTATTAEKPLNPWLSYPDQLQREEERERRLAREKNREILGFGVAGDVVEQWTQKVVDTEEEHRAGVRPTNNPMGSASDRYTHTFMASTRNPTNERVVVSKPPSSPPPAEFCPVTALDMNSDEDSQKGYSGVQPKKLVPFVRLPPPPSRAIEASPAPAADGYTRQEPPRSSDVTRYDRVLGSILKTIEVSKGHQSSPSTSSAAPAKFSETKPVYTDDRESAQQSLTTVSLPPRVNNITTAAEPEDFCTNDEEDFLQRLYIQEFGSQPTVKIPIIFQNSNFSPSRPPSSKAKKPARPKHFAESVPLFEVVGADDLFNDQGYPYIPVRIGPDTETKKIVLYRGWSKPLRKEPRKNAGFTNSSNNNRKSGANTSFYKKDAKPFMNQRQRIQSPNAPKPIPVNAWERQHPVA